MKIIIAGDGKVGLALVRELLREEHEVVVIDLNPEVLRSSLEQYDVMTVEGNAATMETLRHANVNQADLLIAATSTDEVNLLCCLTARKMNRNIHTIARVRNSDYSEQLVLMQKDLGLSLAINPEMSAAYEMFRILQLPGFLSRDVFARGRVEIVELRVDKDSPLNGITLMDLDKTVRVKVLVCAVVRGGEVAIPSGGYTLQDGDHIYVTAETSVLALLVKNLGISTQKIRQVILVGGGHIGAALASLLLRAGIGVKIIERDPEKAVLLAEKLPRAVVVADDGSSKGVLDREGLDHTDALVTLTGIDEENIVVSMYAHGSGVKKVITKVDRLEYSGMFADLGVGSVINPKELCSSSIVRYVRAMQNQKGSVLTLHRIAGGAAEALEFQVDDSVPWRGTPLKDIPLKKGVLISCITHRGKRVIPNGNHFFESGDTVIVVTTAENPFYTMNDIFE
ncbi:MAG: Trk system potassium transporter TrkA [Oscillibacter sp.]|nr:Trk system potassium transporter TrkA [Oscillospiraceae bacterium]MCI8810831.1 Trk system potassium transporter TrkA [Oscillibacter sp.]